MYFLFFRVIVVLAGRSVQLEPSRVNLRRLQAFCCPLVLKILWTVPQNMATMAAEEALWQMPSSMLFTTKALPQMLRIPTLAK